MRTTRTDCPDVMQSCGHAVLQSGSLVVAWYIEKSFPEAVRIDESGYKMVSLNALTAILLQAAKDQQKQIDEMRKEIEEMKNK